MEIPGPLPIVENPPLAFRFDVLFFANCVTPNPIDIMFQKVSGLGTAVELEPLKEASLEYSPVHTGSSLRRSTPYTQFAVSWT